MVARARREGESYKDYRENLYVEDEALKWRLRGLLFHESQKVYQDIEGNIRTRGVTYERQDTKLRHGQGRRRRGYKF